MKNILIISNILIGCFIFHLNNLSAQKMKILNTQARLLSNNKVLIEYDLEGKKPTYISIEYKGNNNINWINITDEVEKGSNTGKQNPGHKRIRWDPFKKDSTYKDENVKFKIIANDSPPRMILIKGGRFNMGNNSSAFEDEKPEHEVEINSFYIDINEVTVADYDMFVTQRKRTIPDQLYDYLIKNNYFPQNFDLKQKNKYPVVNISWAEANEYCNSLGKRLPTEAEWEFAASGGELYNNKTKEYSGNEDYDKVAWFIENSDSCYHSVGELNQNELGLKDMSGNVSEWCFDWYDSEFYSKSQDINPISVENTSLKVIRGGSFADKATLLTKREKEKIEFKDFWLGFRCVISENK